MEGGCLQPQVETKRAGATLKAGRREEHENMVYKMAAKMTDDKKDSREPSTNDG